MFGILTIGRRRSKCIGSCVRVLRHDLSTPSHILPHALLTFRLKCSSGSRDLLSFLLRFSVLGILVHSRQGISPNVASAVVRLFDHIGPSDVSELALGTLTKPPSRRTRSRPALVAYFGIGVNRSRTPRTFRFERFECCL